MRFNYKWLCYWFERDIFEQMKEFCVAKKEIRNDVLLKVLWNTFPAVTTSRIHNMHKYAENKDIPKHAKYHVFWCGYDFCIVCCHFWQYLFTNKWSMSTIQHLLSLRIFWKLIN